MFTSMTKSAIVTFVFSVFSGATLLAAESYKSPDPLVADLVRAEAFSRPYFNRERTALLKAYFEELPSIGYVSRPQLKLAGVRFNPDNFTNISNFYIKKLKYFDLKTKLEKELKIPATAIVREVSWSPDGKQVVLSFEEKSCHSLKLVSIPSLKIRDVRGVCLNAVLGRLVEWKSANELLLRVRTSQQKNGIKIEKQIPLGPVVQESKGIVSQNRTHQDLIKTKRDEDLFAAAVESQLGIYQISSGTFKRIGAPGLNLAATFSPNEKLLLVQNIETPFSYVVPYSHFAMSSEVWSPNGKRLSVIAKGGPFENIPIQGVKTGPRALQWSPNEEQTLIYVEALDKGDWANKVPNRDELFRAKVMSNGDFKAESFLKLKNRFAGLQFLDQDFGYLVGDYERDTEWLTTFLVTHNNHSDWSSKVLFSLNENDDYKNPGEPVYIWNKQGQKVIALDLTEPRGIFMSGMGASPEGDRPFLRRVNLANSEIEELFRSERGSFENFLTFVNDSYDQFLTSFETQEQSPRILLRTRKDTALTKDLVYADTNHFEILTRIKKEIITYKRKDGVALSALLYYPLNYEPGKKYPAIIQAYPLEYTDSATAGQVRGSKDKFERPFREDIVYNALRGYVVLDNAQMPIIGHPETKNDTFVEQLVAGARAAVDVLNERGLIDPKRVGVIGHSYGAFMVANLLTHSDLFATGIAKSGAYNRTLTPYGFQGERRPYWKAKSTYLTLSPFLEAEKVNEPILLIHGQEDNNPGTFTLQTERYFDALKGQGATARMVLLPEESHGYAARESIEHVLTEIFDWFDKYLKAP